MKKIPLEKAVIAAVLSLMLVISVTLISPHFSRPETYSRQITSIDEKIDTVMTLTAGASALSTLISALPDDTGTPIADKMADISGYFLVVLCALYLEKYLLTVIGYVTFSWLLPMILVCAGIGLLSKYKASLRFSLRLAVFSLVLLLAIPTSIHISDLVYKTYESSIDATIQSAQDSLEEAEANVVEEEKQDSSGNIISSAFHWVTVNVTEQIEKFKIQISRYLQALAVLIVTSCLIPLLVLLVMIWLAKLLIEDMGFRVPEKWKKRQA